MSELLAEHLHPSLFTHLPVQPEDPLLSLIALFASDPRPEKIDLGVGVYRDGLGVTPVFNAVKKAEAQLLATQRTKAYLGPEGNLDFIEKLRQLVFADQNAANWQGVQTPGGTGALRLAAQLAAAARPGGTIWVGTPSWPIHAHIFDAAGLSTRSYSCYNPEKQEFDMGSTLAALRHADAGDAVLLQGCGHNPTGRDPSPEQWQLISETIAGRGLLPIVDLAYHGLAENLEADLVGLHALSATIDEILVAYSCDKNFGLYRERTGALFFRTRGDANAVRSTILKFARAAWSMPPDHGAAVVAEILGSPELSSSWRAELNTMQDRLNEVRNSLTDTVPLLAQIAHQRGMFALPPLSIQQVEALRRDHAIYLPASGRINLAGLQVSEASRFVSALSDVTAGQC